MSGPNRVKVRLRGRMRAERPPAAQDPSESAAQPEIPRMARLLALAYRWHRMIEEGAVDDVLARRTRALLLDAGAARQIAPRVASIMARELRRDADWEQRQVADFEAICRMYLPECAGGVC